MTTARKFGADSDGHGRHPILTDARGVTEPPRRLAQQLGVSRKLENRKLALAHWQGPAGQYYHAGAPHVARHAGTEGFKMALEAARNRPTVRGSGAFGQDVYVRVPIPQGRSTGGNSPTTTMAVGWGLTSLRLEIGRDPLTGPAVRPWPPPAPPKWRHPRHRRFQVGLRLSIRVSGPPASRGHRPTRGDRGFRVQSPSQSRQSVSGRPAGPSFPPRLPTRDWNSPTQDPGPGRRLQHSSTDRHSGLQPLENSSPPKRGAGRPALHRRGFNPAAPGKK